MLFHKPTPDRNRRCPGEDMSDDTLLTQTAEQVFADAQTAAAAARDEAVWSAPLWQRVADAGLPLALTYGSEDGITPAEALDVVRVAAAHSAPVPIAETLLANWLLARAGLTPSECTDGPLSFGPVLSGDALEAHEDAGALHLEGRLDAIPFARCATGLVVWVMSNGRPIVAHLVEDEFTTEHGQNLAREPRDGVVVKASVPPDRFASAEIGAADLRAAGATLRAVAMAGALQTLLSRTLEYAGERVQFGRPIAKFQAIQHSLAAIACEAAAARAAADLAAERFGSPDLAVLAAVAKVRAGEAATKAAGLAHQVHGAIGFTMEHPLHLSTQRLWSWRDEFGAESEWSEMLGAAALDAGSGDYWAMITDLDMQAGRQP